MLALMLTVMLASDVEPPTLGTARADELRRAREEKAQHLQAPKRSFVEKGLHELEERQIMERFRTGFAGFRPLVGGMQSGAGFALGSSYSKGKLTASAQVSVKGYQKYGVTVAAPPTLNGKLFAAVRADYRNYTQEGFFGAGNGSRSEDRANYGLEQRSLGGDVGLQVAPQARIGATLGWLESRISSETESRTPALADNARHLQTGAFVEIDTRDEPGNPRTGARYTARWSSFHDRELGQFGFGRYDVEVQQYFSFFNDRRVIALRAKTSFTQAADGQKVPFYMLPSLGGSQELRGYSEFRFRDRNMAVFNAEYRWEAFSGLDLALFADAGQVAPRVRDFAFRDMKTAGGIGFRFNTAKQVFCRVDLGFSKEGPRVFLNFSHVF